MNKTTLENARWGMVFMFIKIFLVFIKHSMKLPQDLAKRIKELEKILEEYMNADMEGKFDG